MPCTLRIQSDDPARQPLAEATAQRYGIRAMDFGGAEDAGGLILALRDDGWELRDADARPGCGLRLDFTSISHRRDHGANLSRRQPLARAVGRNTRRVIDATAGLGHDAALLAAMGFEVLAIERSAPLAMMLDDALHRAHADTDVAKSLGGRLRVVHGDARVLLPAHVEWADCIYLDPMFPPKRKASALAKKEIRLIRDLVGEDDDAPALLRVARAAARRVAVKRPHHAPSLADDTAAIIESNLVRYDIYSRPSSAPG